MSLALKEFNIRPSIIEIWTKFLHPQPRAIVLNGQRLDTGFSLMLSVFPNARSSLNSKEVSEHLFIEKSVVLHLFKEPL